MIWHTPEPASAAARYVWEMITALTANGTAVTLICPRNYQFLEELRRNPLVTLELTRARSTSTQRGLAGKLWTNGLFLSSSAFALFRTARRSDLVHFQYVLHFPFSAVFFVAALLKRCKIVFTVHDPVPHKWLLPPTLRWLDRGLLRWAYQVSDVLIVHSEPGKVALLDQFHLDGNTLSVIGHGPYGLGGGVIPMPHSENLELLVFGSIRDNKGIDLAIEAVQRLHARGAAIRLTIAGEIQNGNQAEYWEHCLRLIARDPEAIHVDRGFIPDDRLPELFAQCHCVLLPYTRFFSDSGVAAMAMANGRTIVATRVGGLGPLLDSSGVGVGIEEATVTSVCAAIEEVARLDIAELTRQGQAAADYVNGECGWPKCAEETRRLYDSYRKGPRESAVAA